MKKLGKLKLSPEKMLNNEELLSYRGGSGNCQNGLTNYWCECIGSVGTWNGCYASQSEADARIIYWCASGNGRCIAKPA